MCNRLHHFAAAIAILAGAALTAAQIPAHSLHTNPAAHAPADASDALAAPAAPDPPNDPVADPKAMVVFGKARFTVLTGQLVRMEWAADGKFEDHASLVFINRRLPAAKFVTKIEYAGKVPALEIKTAAITLTYSPNPDQDARFTADNLSISLDTGDKLTVWRPGLSDDQNLMGTTRTLGVRPRNHPRTRDLLSTRFISECSAGCRRNMARVRQLRPVLRVRST